MSAPTIFTICVESDDSESGQSRITKVLAGNTEVRCAEVTLEHTAGNIDTLLLRIPLRYVHIEVTKPEEF